MNNIKLKSPAKINLHLEVKHIREDGFHEIFSLFQMIDFYDLLDIELSKTNDCEIIGNFDFPIEKNIMYKAYVRFKELSNTDFGLLIKIKKNIPMEAGLGGGSSNAASVLFALNKFFPGKLSRDLLFDLAAELGSDVPFFLGAASAIVKGRGEILEPLIRKVKYRCLIIVPDFKICTSEAYSWIDSDIFEFDKLVDAKFIRKTYLLKTPDTFGFYNSFAPSIAKRFSQVNDIINDLYDSGAVYANISGSGSAFFGVYDSAKVFIAKKILKSQYKQISIRKPLDRNEHCI